MISTVDIGRVWTTETMRLVQMVAAKRGVEVTTLGTQVSVEGECDPLAALVVGLVAVRNPSVDKAAAQLARGAGCDWIPAVANDLGDRLRRTLPEVVGVLSRASG